MACYRAAGCSRDGCLLEEVLPRPPAAWAGSDGAGREDLHHSRGLWSRQMRVRLSLHSHGHSGCHVMHGKPGSSCAALAQGCAHRGALTGMCTQGCAHSTAPDGIRCSMKGRTLSVLQKLACQQNLHMNTSSTFLQAYKSLSLFPPNQAKKNNFK